MPKKMSCKTSRPNRRAIERYRQFAEAYLDLSNPQTFLKSEGSAKKAGYSESFARGRSYELLARVGIQKEIEAIRAEARGNPNIASPDEVLEALTAMVRMLPNRLFHPETKEFIGPADMTDTQAQALAGYKMTQRVIPGSGEGAEAGVETKWEFRLIDRLRALEMLGRWHGIWEKDNRQKQPTVPQALVAFPTGVMTLSEWQKQAEEILAQRDADKVCGDAGNKSQPAGTREGR
jgi:phage terminase small subunit